MDEILPNAIGLWALLFLCENDCIRIREFFARDWNIDRRFILREMHISVYHAQREMPGVASIVEPLRIILPAAETRFMTFAPGGFEPTADIIPGEKKVGIRVHGKGAALLAILALRKRLLVHESAEMLGERFPSTMRKSAFGRRNFEAHMALLREGSGITSDLRAVGAAFRQKLGDLVFDRFEIRIHRGKRTVFSAGQSRPS